MELRERSARKLVPYKSSTEAVVNPILIYTKIKKPISSQHRGETILTKNNCVQDYKSLHD